MPAVRLAHLDLSRLQGEERRRTVPARDPQYPLHVGEHVRLADVEPHDGAGAGGGAARRHEVGEDLAVLDGPARPRVPGRAGDRVQDRKSTRLNSSHGYISYAVFCLKKKKEVQRSPALDEYD